MAHEVTYDVLEVTVEEGGSEEAPYLIFIADFSDIRPSPRNAFRVRGEEVTVREAVHTAGYDENDKLDESDYNYELCDSDLRAAKTA